MNEAKKAQIPTEPDAPVAGTTLVGLFPEKLERLMDAVCEGKPIFDGFYRPPLVMAANAVGALPFSREVGQNALGALSVVMDAAVVAVNVAKSRMFNGNAPQNERRQLDRQSTYMVFLATVFSLVAMTFEQVELRGKDHMVFHPMTSSVKLSSWIERHGPVSWRWKKTARVRGPLRIAVAARLISSHLLEDFDYRMVARLFDAMYDENRAAAGESGEAVAVRQAICATLAAGLAAGSKDGPGGVSADGPLYEKIEPPPPPPPVKPKPKGPPPVSDELHEVLKTFSTHPLHSNLKCDMDFTDEGVVIPMRLFTIFSVGQQKVLDLLKASGRVLRVQKDGCMVLDKTLAQYFLRKVDDNRRT